MEDRFNVNDVALRISVWGIGLWLAFLSPSIEAQEKAVSLSKYSFENDEMGWMPQTYVDSQACVEVVQSDASQNAKEGKYVLKMTMDIVGGDANKGRGEAWVNMNDDPPGDETIPIDLTNRTITAWIYAPKGSKGDPKKPNGLQVFVKDDNWKNEYGPWFDIDKEDEWFSISLTVRATKPKKGGYMDSGFDPSKIIAIGVKMGAGGGSTAKYPGVIYVDAVNW